MYMNSMRRRNCNCGYTNMQDNMCNSNNAQDSNCDNKDNNIYQKVCSDVANYSTMHDGCECGFDEEDGYFPKNPMLAQSYVPTQTMNKVFIPSVRIKNGNYLSRTS